jgi:hypothetical protein
MRLTGVALASCTLLALFACANDSSGGATTGDLTGVTWVLDHASMMTLAHSMPKDAQITLAFDGRQAQGSAACNPTVRATRPTPGPGR